MTLKKSIYITAISFVGQFAIAQDCSCEQSLNQLQSAIEKNYAGFDDKVNVKTKKIYEKLIQKLKVEALTVENEKGCHDILKNYVAFYKDGHLNMEDFRGNLLNNLKYQALPEGNLDDYFKNIDLTKDIRGIYTSENYELAVVPDAKQKNVFVGIVVSSKNEKWKKGMIKMVLKPQKNNYYKTTFLYGDFEQTDTEAYFSGAVLDILAVSIFEKKLSPAKKQNFASKYQSVFPREDISFSFPNEKTAVLFLGSFQTSNEKVIDSLMTFHKTELEKRPNWIIDLSYNGGGGTGTYRSILPYLYTNPIKRSGSYYKLSKANVEHYKTFLEQTPNLPPMVKASFENYIKVGTEKPDSWHFEEGPTFTFDTISTNPKRIAVLTSPITASSAEIFLMDAKQSKKVTIFGSQSAGVVDYGDFTTFEIRCTKIKINIPARRSEYLNKEAFDNVGIKPDILCDPKEAMKVALQKFK
jgi:hypothetical protein